MYCRYTVIIATVSYQYCYYLYYREIYLRRYIFCYFSLTQYDSVIFIMFILNFHKKLFFKNKY